MSEMHDTAPRYARRETADLLLRGPAAAHARARRPRTRTPDGALKRAFDIAVAASALLVLAPLLAALALGIKLDSPGPVLFRQRRTGQGGRIFRVLKFRSMTTLEDGALIRQATASDPRITRLGAVLRRTNLDELPQLWNVLRGDMSIVGPRPHALAHDQAFARLVPGYARRFAVRPGITGWAQIHGWRGETDTEEKVRQRVAHDLWYVEHRSFALDLSICLRTLTACGFRNAR